MPTLYKYDPSTLEYIGTCEAIVDPCHPGAGVSYIDIPYTTTKEPPTPAGDHKTVIFNSTYNYWHITPDYRGMTIYHKITKEATEYKKIGVLPTEYTLVAPDPIFEPFQTWNEENGVWEIADSTDKSTGKLALLDAIWVLRKQKREIECNSDIIYKGYSVHVDSVSFNDITLAAQEAILSSDMETTKKWITADGREAQFNGNDFVAIMKAYGARRQTLVYESNAAWQEDTKKSIPELQILYKELLDIVEGK